MVERLNQSSQPGIFAAGEVTDIYTELVLMCIGEGVKAALSACEYILSLS
jgi:alkyl hydroperoxide reductase subunit F